MDVQAGRGVLRTRNHWWWRPGWEVGQRMYTMHLTFEHCHELHLLAARLRPALAGHRTQDIVPDGGLHLTMTEVGFVDEVSEARLEQVSDAVFDHLDALPGGVLTLEGIMVGAEGVLLNARKDVWLTELSRLQREAVEEALGPREWGGPLWPHISLSYSNGSEPVSSLVEAVSDAAPPQPTLVVARPRLTLMRLHRDSRRYDWEVLRQHVWRAV